jgi:hypothetical protein
MGTYKSYSRLVDIYINETGISWQPIWEFPSSLSWLQLGVYCRLQERILYYE